MDYGYDLNDFELGFTGTVDGHTPYGIKPFLGTRYNSTLGQLDAVKTTNGVDIAQVVTAFPNPFGPGQMLHLHSKSPVKPDLQVTIIDLQGRIVQQSTWAAHETTTELDLGSLATGSYRAILQGKGVFGAIGLAKL
ncbi:MAG: T9SS type A sorting domain-containing protein [Bacteroidetes bacterium]|nr:T9SS type A sorting domain-containing protein [Bacteroidota bacterium]